MPVRLTLIKLRDPGSLVRLIAARFNPVRIVRVTW